MSGLECFGMFYIGEGVGGLCNVSGHCGMFAFIYACTHVYINACMHVCMYACMHACVSAYMHVCHVCMPAFIYACMLVCMYVRGAPVSFGNMYKNAPGWPHQSVWGGRPRFLWKYV